MNIKTEFTEPECEYFRKTCNFTDEEMQLFNMRVKGKSIVEIAIKESLSDSSVKRKLRNVKRKINKVL